MLLKFYKSPLLCFSDVILDQICSEIGRFEFDRISTLLSWTLTCHTFAASGRRELHRLHSQSSAKRSPLGGASVKATKQRRSGILSFPEEVLDQICDHVERLDYSVKQADPSMAKSTPYLRSWLSTCRAFRPSGERALYRTPFRSHNTRWSQRSVYALLRTLETRPDLASHVRNLTHVGLTMDLAYVAYVHPRNPAGLPDALAWQLRVIKLCRNIEVLGVYLVEWDTEALGTAAASLSRMNKIHLRFPRMTTRSEVKLAGIRVALPQDLQYSPTQNDFRIQPFATDHLRVSVGQSGICAAAFFLPRTASNLTFLSIYTKDFTPVHAFSHTDLFFRITPYLLRVADMTLDKLDLLVRSSPHIEHLNLRASKWSSSSSLPPAELKTQIRRALSQLGMFPPFPLVRKRVGQAEVVWQVKEQDGEDDPEDGFLNGEDDRFVI
ncbi:hypothetical protein JCM8097_006709 [Rhodosporidiobolus ruineniae]